MRRRSFLSGLAGAAAFFPRASAAQQPALPIIGFLSSRSSSADASLISAFKRGLAAAGFTEGKNVAIDYRWANGDYSLLRGLADDLVRKPVSVLVSTGGTPAAQAAKAATRTVPIVFTTADDPVKVGLVASLQRPGGNLTGITASFVETASKRLELLQDLLPKASRIGLLVNPLNPATIREAARIQEAAQETGQHVDIFNASDPREIAEIYANLKRKDIDAVIVAPDPYFFLQADHLIGLERKHSSPTLYFRREFVVAGGLLSYGSDFAEHFRIVGTYAGRILHGAQPAGMPVQQPSTFELVLNLRTARALGLDIPTAFLVRADEIIE
ncbi:ABC transporter substrate-binding protein [Methylobacterium oryzisoli]|uniref:ABC transporter substrate-binding protein n=1 Tax=Methylobacterium oryzisoli TaxID=3385502 RepID=UPI003891D94D